MYSQIGASFDQYRDRMSNLGHGLTSPRRAHGVTLIELLITIVIAAILLTIGVPSYRYVTNANRVASEANGLLGDLQFARAEAIKEGQTVTACVSADGATCTGPDTWQTGWIVFSDVNNDQTVDAGDAVLRVQQPFANLGSADTLVASNAVVAVTFNREGFATNLAAGTLMTLHEPSGNSAWTHCLSITTVGLMTTATANVNSATATGNCT